MEPMSLLMFLFIGAVAGWLAGLFMKGSGSGLVMNVVLGIIGAVIGGWIFGFVGVSTGGMMGSLATAVVGACVLLFVVGLIRK